MPIQTFPKDTALLIVDPQNDFCPGGHLPVTAGDQIIPVINRLRPNFNLVIVSQDWHPRGHISFASSHDGKNPFNVITLHYGKQVLWPDHCVQNTPDAEFHPDLITRPEDIIIRKGTSKGIDSYSAFFENDHATRPTFDDGKNLTQKLKGLGIKNLYLAGLAFDYCVGWTALDGVTEGFKVSVIEDATRGISPDSIASMKERFESEGVKIVQSHELANFLTAASPGPRSEM